MHILCTSANKQMIECVGILLANLIFAMKAHWSWANHSAGWCQCTESDGNNSTLSFDFSDSITCRDYDCLSYCNSDRAVLLVILVYKKEREVSFVINV